MNLLFVTVLSILINCIFCSIDRGGDYLELNNASEEAYMFSNKDCTRVYLCRDRYIEKFIKRTDHLRKCYYKNIDYGEFFPKDMQNPDKCDLKGYVDINSEKCYFTNDGMEVSHNKPVHWNRSRYYDIDNVNKRALTEWGWCDFKININEGSWMSNLPDNLKLNQINIPGTHDSGTYGIYDRIEVPWSRTQTLDIKDQLFNGIRYLDIRIETNGDHEMYISHWYIDSKNKKTGKNYFISDIFDETIEFLHKNSNETVIMQLKDERVADFNGSEMVKKIADISVLNEKIVYGKPYKNYFYTGNFYGHTRLPDLGEVRGKIVILTRDDYQYKLNPNDDDDDAITLGYRIQIPDMASCRRYEGDICYPIINNNIRVQDNYKVDKYGKWGIVRDMLNHNIPSRTSGDRGYTVYDKDSPETNKFYDLSNKDVLTLNFLNVEAGWANPLLLNGIKDTSTYINDRLFNYITKETTIHNEWFIFDYPSPDNIRKIFQSNKFIEQNFNIYEVELNKKKYHTDLYYLIVSFFGLNLRKRSEYDEDVYGCLQRKIVNNNGIEIEVIKTGDKCINNNLNKWRIKQNDKFYTIMSAYDTKCLNYDPQKDSLYMKDCDENNKYQDFAIKNSKICSRLNETKCLDGNYDIRPLPIESPKYEHLTCSYIFEELGFSCCYDQNTQVEYVDEIGNWGIENGKLCGIGYTRCSFEALGYHCCSSSNPEVVSTDANGSWGFEDGQWCGIGEAKFNSNVRIRNLQKNKCLVTYPSNNSNPDRLVLGECNTEYSSWSIKENKIISDILRNVYMLIMV